MPAYSFPEPSPSHHLGEDRDDALIENGYDLIMYCATPSRGLSKEVRKQYRKRRYEVQRDGHLIIHRYYLPVERKSTALRTLRYLLQCIKMFNRAVFCKDARSCDVMWMSSTPPFKAAFMGFAKRIIKKPLIYNVQDIFPDSLIGTGMAKKDGLLWKIGNAISNYAYKQADAITVISNDFRNNLLNKGVPEKKIKLIYNWVDENSVIGIDRSKNVLFDRFELDRNKFYLTYCGNIGLTQNFEFLLSIMRDIQTDFPNIELVIIGDGAYRKTLEISISEHELKNVYVFPFQPYEDISYVFSLGDVGLVISKPGVGENSVPSKTWSIMSASRPVLASFDENELKEIIINSGCGIFTKAGDRNALLDSIVSFYSDRAFCEECGRKGRLFVENNLSKQKCTSQFISLINEIVNQN
jgi:glycosyltransferase involved in cell wall biosynthesis